MKREGMTVPQVAARLGVSACVVRRFVEAGLIPTLPREPGQWQRFRPEDVDQFIAMGGHIKGRHVPAVMRIWAKVQQNGDGCWTWTGGLNKAGYGQVSMGDRDDRRAESTHRFMYETVFGPIPDGLHLDHLCRNRACCNPWHLEPVTCRENVLRGVGFAARHARQTHCKNGHEFTPENTYSFAAPTRGVVAGRSCRRCHARNEARRRARLFRRSDVEALAAESGRVAS